MIKRMSLVWKRPGLSDADFRTLWLGEHAEVARRIPGAREYVIDFIPDAPVDLPSAVAVLRFDDRTALDRAFADQALAAELTRTREAFAAHVAVFIVDEAIVISPSEGAS
jgi:hypothetical protein